MALACGDEVETIGSSDGPAGEMALPPPDGSTDQSIESGSADVAPGDAALDQELDEGSTDGFSPDSEACAATMTATFFGACTNESCGPSDYCAYSEGPYAGNFSICYTVPDCCLPRPTCACVVASTQCNLSNCTDEGGRIVLTCERPPPP
jgi:hypothetical protein